MKVGFTTSFPVEIVIAAGHTPIDLNNIFIAGDSLKSVEKAEAEGFPRNICSWIKGMYSVIIDNHIDIVVGVVQGDCSNTHSLMHNLKDKNISVLNFSFPYGKDKTLLEKEIANLISYFGTTRKEVTKVKNRLDIIRKKLIRLDELTYLTHQVSGAENHYWLVSSSDFKGDPDRFEKELDSFLKEASERPEKKYLFRLAYIGVPPVYSDIYDYLSDMSVEIIFNEVQRQFSMPSLKDSIIEQYLEFTYPYSVFERIADINTELYKRKADGVISYVQSFCHRQIDNILLKKYLNYPFLTVEGDQPGKLDARTKLRIESFLDMIRN